MSVTPTYPGVYIEEIPSGVNTIATGTINGGSAAVLTRDITVRPSVPVPAGGGTR